MVLLKERFFIFVAISAVFVFEFFAFVLISAHDKRQIFMYVEFNCSFLRTFGRSQSGTNLKYYEDFKRFLEHLGQIIGRSWGLYLHRIKTRQTM